MYEKKINVSCLIIIHSIVFDVKSWRIHICCCCFDCLFFSFCAIFFFYFILFYSIFLFHFCFFLWISVTLKVSFFNCNVLLFASNRKHLSIILSIAHKFAVREQMIIFFFFALFILDCAIYIFFFIFFALRCSFFCEELWFFKPQIMWCSSNSLSVDIPIIIIITIISYCERESAQQGSKNNKNNATWLLLSRT